LLHPDVTAAVRADLAAGSIRSRFRLRFSGSASDSDGIDDLAVFSGAERTACGATADDPMLLVRYEE
jgi:hypothetical protein